MILTVPISTELSGRLTALAQKTGRSKAFYARKMIEDNIDEIEDLYLAEQEVEAIRTGESVTIPLDEVVKSYGLSD